VEISKVQAKIDKKTGKKTEATFLKAGERGVCVLKVQIYVFRWREQFVCRNTISCQVWEDLRCVMRGSNFVLI